MIKQDTAPVSLGNAVESEAALPQRYVVYATEDDEMYVMSQAEVFEYLQEHSEVCRSFSVYTDGSRVHVCEPSVGANGKLSDTSVDEFFHGFDDDGIIIRKVSNWPKGSVATESTQAKPEAVSGLGQGEDNHERD